MKKVRSDQGEDFWLIELTLDGVPIAIDVAVDEADAEVLLTDLANRLPEIWPSLRSTMESAFADYDHAEDFPPPAFLASLSRMTPDVYMGDQSSFHLRFFFEVDKFSDSIPIYDFFLNDRWEIVDYQPVF